MGYTDLLGSIMYTLPSSRPCRWVLLLIWYAPIVGGLAWRSNFLGAWRWAPSEQKRSKLDCAALLQPPNPLKNGQEKKKRLQ